MTMSRTPTLAEFVREAITNRLEDVHVALPGRIESYDLATQQAEIKPLIKRAIQTADGDDLLEELPIIHNVPIVFPRGGDGFFVSFPLVEGNLVTLIFCERSIDKYTAGSGKDTDPVDFRRHDLTDAVAFPGFYPFSESLADAHADNMVLGKDGGAQVHIKPDEVDLYEENAADFVALAATVDSRLDNLETFAGSHTHSYAAPVHVSPAPGSTAAASGAPSGTTTAATKVRAT